MNSSKIINSILLLFLTTTISLSQAPPPTPVEVALVEERVLKRPVSFVGNVVPFKRSVIASEVEGLVGKFLVYEGQFVKEGDVLVEFKTSTLEINLKEAKASTQEAASRYKAEKPKGGTVTRQAGHCGVRCNGLSFATRYSSLFTFRPWPVGVATDYASGE